MIAFARYIFSAGAASVVDFVLVQALLLIPLLHSGLWFGLTVALGALAGMSVNFALSRRFVFGRNTGPDRAELIRFFLISLSTLILRVVVAYAAMAILLLPVFSWVMGLPLDAPITRISHIAAMGLVTIYSFFAHKYVSFAGTPSPELATR
jgi:putative flippase GtrA